MNLLINIVVLILGSCIGSFLNVVLYRFPFNKSIVIPRSYCPNCKTNISWFDNIPILSWVFLKAKCRNCKKKISIQYPLVELLTGILFLIPLYFNSSIYSNLNHLTNIFSSWVIISLFILLTIFDLKYYWLPNSLNILGIIFSIFLASYYSILNNNLVIFFNLLSGLIAFLLFFIISLLGKNFFKKEVLGVGDIKLISFIGFLLGIKGSLVAIYLSFVSSGIFSLIIIFLKGYKKNQYFPFGPFIVCSSLIVWFAGPDIFMKYQNYLSNLFIN